MLIFQIMQYLITGGALAGSVLVLVACCSAISYAIKRRKQKNLSPTDVSIATKYLVSLKPTLVNVDQQLGQIVRFCWSGPKMFFF
jgi:hypothetical protein